MRDKKTIIIVDDNKLFLELLKNKIEKQYDCFNIVTIDNAVEIIPLLQKNFELLIVDWEMPQLNGKKILNYTKKIGIPYYKIVIVSSKNAEELHKHFKKGEVLSVINKTDVNQMNALYMIIENISCY